MKTRISPLAVALAAAVSAMPAVAQVVTDGSMGPRVTLQAPFNIGSALGTFSGRNLFHSFQIFSVGPGQTALFTSTQFVDNIIARVTGNRASIIEGTVRSTLANTNLFLVNPSGIVFGPNALVDVNGSFYASTAHYLRFADGVRVTNEVTSGVTLAVSTPTGFGFESRNVAPIAVRNSVLRAREGGTVALIGGGIVIGGGTAAATSIQARGGTVAVVAVASPGVVELRPEGPAPSGFDAMADVVLERGADINVLEGPARGGGGSVFIRGNNVSLDQAQIRVSTVFGNGRAIDIQAQGDVNIRHSNVVAVTTGAGAAGSIRVTGRNVSVSDGSLVDTSCDPGCTTGNGGRIEVRATDVFYIDGRAGPDPTFVVSNSFGGGRTGEIDVTAGTMVLDGGGRLEGGAYLQGIATEQGDASRISIHTGNIVLLNGGQVDSSTRGPGRGGQIIVDNTGSILLQGSRPDPVTIGHVQPSGFISNAGGSGDAGSIVVNTRALDILGGGEISSAAIGTFDDVARFRSSGQGGSITVNATASIVISGIDANNKQSSITTNTFATGDAGEISLSAPVIAIASMGSVRSQSEGRGRAGRIHIAGGDLTMTAQGQISSDAFASGNGGTVDVSLTGTLAMSGDDTGIFAQAYHTGAGGNIGIAAARVVLNGRSGIFATTKDAGDAGTINVNASDSIALAGGARIASETLSSGAAGNLDIRSGATLSLSDRAQITTSSGLGGGTAGSVTLQAENITLSRDALIASESQSSGFAGNLAIRAAGTLDVSSGGRITTSALFSDGGNILIEVPRAVTMSGGTIATAVSRGQGDGGNITLKTDLLLMRDSVVSANAFGGRGGNVSIGATNLFSNPATRVTASSELGIDGTVVFQSPAIDLSGALLVLATGFLDVSAIAAGRCGPRLAAGASSLIVRRFDAGESLRNGFRLSSPAEPRSASLAESVALCERA